MTIDVAIRAAVADAVAPLAEKIDALGRRVAPPPEWLTIREAAETLGVAESTVRRWAKDGQIEARGSGKARRVKVN